MIDETNAYAVKINGVTFVSMDAAKSIVDEARMDSWNMALEEAARVCDPKGNCSEMDAYGAGFAAAIRALKENADDKT